MSELRDFLCERLAGTKRLAILGVGSLLRGDDAAGMLIVERLMEAFAPQDYPNLMICGGGTAPENFSGNVRLFAPDHMLIVDAADAGCEPGSIVDIPRSEIGGPSFSSHMLPLKIMVDYLVNETGTNVTMLGLQYKDIAFGEDLSPEMHEAVDELTKALLAAIPTLF
jgi:hydrogenase 3 maturation protease